MAYLFAHPGSDRLDAEVITAPDSIEKGDAGSRHPQAGPWSSSAVVGVRGTVMAPNLVL